MTLPSKTHVAPGTRASGRASAGASSAEAVAAVGRRAGQPLREIAADLYGREQVDGNWDADAAMRSKLRRLLRQAGAGPGAGDDTGRAAGADSGVARRRGAG